METTKMTVRVSKETLQRAKQYAHENDTTLTRLITAYLEQLSTNQDPLKDAPIVRRLLGSLSQDVSQQDYYRYLEEKYGQTD